MPRFKSPVRPSFVVVIQHSELNTEVIGPYRSFKRADADAQAMGGACLPLTRIRESTGEMFSVEKDSFKGY